MRQSMLDSYSLFIYVNMSRRPVYASLIWAYVDSYLDEADNRVGSARIDETQQIEE